MEIYTKNNGATWETLGMIGRFGYELSATVEDLSLSEECRDFVNFVAEYVSNGNILRSGETLKYGYWLTKVILDDQRRMIFWEHAPDTTEFIHGVKNTLFYWQGQHQICQKVGAAFCPPSPDQMIVISDGVYEGDEVEGVRYPSPSHMSGWWLTTDRYNGNAESLKTVHAHHVSATRPDLAKFLALPNGFRFFSPQSDVWFDEKILPRSS